MELDLKILNVNKILKNMMWNFLQFEKQHDSNETQKFWNLKTKQTELDPETSAMRKKNELNKTLRKRLKSDLKFLIIE